jgi:aryl-phospho-beta-D-glucosidase BglC (GH1 family)
VFGKSISSCLILLLFSLQSQILLAQTNEWTFFHAKGTEIVSESGDPIFFKGVAFGNRVWNNDRIPVLHHSSEDFLRVKKMGMNLVRFYLNYKTFESDEKPYHYLDDGWKWLDDNVAWAKQHGVYLILNIHIPQGGFQSTGNGWALWEKAENQKRLIALWKAIAARYKDEPVIMGYDLLNEPGVPKSKQEWKTLAQTLVNEIRSVDKRHPIFIERVNSVKKNWDNDKEMNYVLVEGENLIYEFHIYDPYFYTHQLAEWDDYMRNRDGGIWPDPKKDHTKKFLEKQIDKHLAWGKKHNVPLYLGEWGLYKANFEKNRGGLNWVKDMLDIIAERKITNTYHVYHEESFGIFRGDGAIDPNNINQPLMQLFQEYYQ